LTDVITGNIKCKQGTDTNMFFDLKKGGSEVGDTDDNFRTTCCTSCEAATCSDWQTVKTVGCGNNKMISASTVLSSSDCSIPTDSDYTSACCVDIPTPPTPMKCSAYSEDVDTAVRTDLPVVRTAIGFFALVAIHFVF